MQPLWYNIVTGAVEAGLLVGYNRAYKHTDQPDQETILTQQYDAIMLALGEVIDWEQR